MEVLEHDAKTAAVKIVANMLQRPDQLEKCEKLIQVVSRKKNSVEAMLKTAVQSQLDGVMVGLQQLQSTLKDINSIQSKLIDIEGLIKPLSSLNKSVQQVQEEYAIHSQYAVAMENLKHIFKVPESVEKTRQWISEGKLLHAHQSLTDLENSRDDLLYELHRLPSHSIQDQQMLKAYFSGVEQLSEQLGKQLWLVLGRSLNIVRKEPQVVVTAVRIIERETRVDRFVIERQKQSGFLPPGRPKNWRQRALEVLRDSVNERIVGNQFEEREDNKMWLVRHLEVTRLLVIEDLRVVKTLCSPCFPPHWDIFNQFFQFYHSNLSKHLEEIIAAGLIANEQVVLLAWVLQTYPTTDLIMHSDLKIDLNNVEPLLKKSTVNQLVQGYLGNMTVNYRDWMKRTIETEARDWRRPVAPEDDGEQHYHTEGTVIIFQMVEQNLTVSRTVSEELMLQALNLGLEQIVQYGLLYREAINQYKSKHFEDRSQVPYFTLYMIAIINNCLNVIELSNQMKLRYLKERDQTMAKSFESLLKTYQQLRDDAAGYLLEEAFLDLEPHFQDLFTRKWITSTTPVDTICATLEDYFQDYMHLLPKNFDYVIREAELCIARKYTSSMFQKKISLKNEERREAAEKMLREAGQIASLLAPASSSLATARAVEDAPQEAIAAIAEVIKSDLEMVSLELHGFLKKYPDLNQEQLIYLLNLRGDFNRSEAREMASGLLSENSQHKTHKTTIFSQIPVSASIFS